ncbi:MAG: radical SAM protein [Thermoplasmata archaeon]
MRTVIWNIDFKCNLLCKGCNAFEGNVLFPKDRIDDFIDEMKYNKVRIVSVTGGEPTLHPDLPRIMKTLKEKGFITHIATNGTNKYVLSKIYPYLDAATISLDSHVPELHNEYRGRKIFDIVVESMKYLRPRVKVLTSNILVTDFNYNRIGEYAKFVNEEIGVPASICFPDNSAYYYEKVPVENEQIKEAFDFAFRNYKSFAFGNTRTYYKEAIDWLEKRPVQRCRAGEEVFYADYRGDVYPCFYKTTRKLNTSRKWEKWNNNCNECFIQCFREPSMKNVLEQATLVTRIYLYNRRHNGNKNLNESSPVQRYVPPDS